MTKHTFFWGVCLLLLLSAVWLPAHLAQARTSLAPIVPDSTFGQSGTATIQWAGYQPAHGWIAERSDGTLVLAAMLRQHPGNAAALGLAHLRPDGSPDTSFGTNGALLVPQSDPSFMVRDMILQENQTLVLVERGGWLILQRYTPAGTLDISFGTNGEVALPMQVLRFTSGTVSLQNDGKILVGGGQLNSYNYIDKFAVMRLHPDGIADASFGQSGIVAVSFTGEVSDLTQLATGHILATGMSNGGFGVIRFTESGQVDTSFGNGGFQTVLVYPAGSSTQTPVRPTHITVQADGKIVVVGHTGNPYRAMTRLHADGTVDAEFGTNGVFHQNDALGTFDDVVLTTDQRILATGWHRPQMAFVQSHLSPFTIAGQYESDGIVSGVVNTYGAALLIQSGGRGNLLQVSYTTPASGAAGQMTVMRYD
nr:hypothetical protein [Ardenticatenales bacterium]